MLRIAPVIGGEGRIAAAIGFEGGLKVLQSVDEGQDGRFVSGQSGFADAHASISAFRVSRMKKNPITKVSPATTTGYHSP